jgi:hypothetical protein
MIYHHDKHTPDLLKLPIFDVMSNAQYHLFTLNTHWKGEGDENNLTKWMQFKNTLCGTTLQWYKQIDEQNYF